MNLINYFKSFTFFSLTDNLFKRSVENAFYSGKPYKLPEFISKSVYNSAVNYLAQLNESSKSGIHGWKNDYPMQAEKLLTTAEGILKGKLVLINKTTDGLLLESLPWQQDVFSAFQYPSVPAWKITPEGIAPNAEAAIPFSLGRLHFCTTLGVAFQITGNERFAEAVCRVLTSFKEENPIGIGIQWHDTSEVAVRAINIMYLLILLHEYLLQHPENHSNIMQILFSHAVFLDSTNKKERFTDHKTMMVLLALFMSGTVFQSTEFGKDLTKRSIALFEQEVRKQVLHDGVAYFHSIASHCILVECIQLLKLHCRYAGYQLTPHLKEKYHLLNTALRTYLDSTGRLPNIGDTVIAGILNFEQSEATPEAESLLTTQRFINPEIKTEWPPLQPTLTHYIHFPATLVSSLTNNVNTAPNPSSAALLAGGHFMLRSQESSVFVKAAEIGKEGHGAPGHNDSFTFELFHKGTPFVVDAGTYSFYASNELRNALRSVNCHNTFYIDLVPLAELVGTSGIKSDLTKPSVLEWHSDNSEDRLVAQHFAYIRLDDPVICKRTFQFNKEKNKLRIKDEFLGGADHIIASNIHLAPEVQVERIDHLQFRLFTETEEIRVQFHIANDSADIAVQDTQISPAYGRLVPSKRLHLRYQETLPAFYVMEFSLL